MTIRRLLALSLVGLIAIAGCKSKTAANLGSPDKGPQVVLDPATLGEVSGTIHLSGKPPEAISIDKSMDPACSLSGGETFAEQYVVHDGGLANVFVYVKTGPAAAMATGLPAVHDVLLDQKGCVYTPHVVGVQAGGSVVFRNDDPTMHNVHTMPTMVGNAAVDISEGPRGTPQAKQFNQPELMIPVRCNNHPWMNAFINVSATPFFAVTGPDGSFHIKGVPAGDYTLGVVHEKLGEQTVAVAVKPQAAAKVDFAFVMK